ncbi:uroporphyrinogen-III C-methyltransferase [Furfurilactobacillus siliginis]|uniref:Uroporphyrinogen-III C-methyltransferase n=1 Tax=Furfurilactobacillus siliginis TaxID=348151 RepID=A0A0R2L357_9LACO|nr:uroporphyrinogen-III C-methyltransferase [Furfurilactobacillus siliginis]KRN96191.1 uroporphyrinogen-iii c-methyltransferase coba [Furfurilactobacillus siliginis]GEK27884.1 uroporphyrinogen-III C-methyltransferase [Furfurilactobacillus siliginis]
MGTGLVTLLGAGPGNIELLTLLGQRRLKEADVVVYDHLINPDLLSYANVNAHFINVGKLPYQTHISQDEINALLVKAAIAGKRVVRLKAGDPFVFGRGGEEAQVLRTQGIPFEIVPGLTSAIAGLEAVGIPVTHRDYASSFHIITAHNKKDKLLNWKNISSMEGTLVFLMGVAELPTIVEQLIHFGKSAETPVAIVQWATQWRQKMGVGTLANIQEVVEQKKLGAPALIAVGGVVDLTRELNVSRTLDSRHILLPNSRHREMQYALSDEGASVDFFNVGTVEELPVSLPDFKQKSRLVVTNVKSFTYLTDQLLKNGMDLRVFTGWEIVATNKLVGSYLKTHGLLPKEIISTEQIQAGDYIVGEKDALSESADRQDVHVLVSCQYRFPDTLQSTLADFSDVVLTSTRAAKALLNGANEEQLNTLKQMHVVAMGRSVAELLKAAGFRNVDVRNKILDVISTLKGGDINE